MYLRDSRLIEAAAGCFAQPIAHRGLHGAPGVVENSRAAATAAIAARCAIECDVQLSADGEAIVFHDDTLERLTAATGPVGVQTLAALRAMTLGGSRETIPTLAEFLTHIAGAAPLVVELKSRFDGDLGLARRVAELVATYDGPLVVESFDPDPIAFLRRSAAELGIAHVPLGIVAMADYGPAEWPDLPGDRRTELTHFLHFSRSQPDFLSWCVDDLPHAVPTLLREGLGLPVTAWTVRTPAQRALAGAYADQIVFEGAATSG